MRRLRRSRVCETVTSSSNHLLTAPDSWTGLRRWLRAELRNVSSEKVAAKRLPIPVPRACTTAQLRRAWLHADAVAQSEIYTAINVWSADGQWPPLSPRVSFLIWQRFFFDLDLVQTIARSGGSLFPFPANKKTHLIRWLLASYWYAYGIRNAPMQWVAATTNQYSFGGSR
jgi:hypothetical protein